ncbi:asb052 [Agrotis segetum nucleopolyhedrovirus B]|uniref:Asb052 n=1 Tax=Agrotis segetum nucleopolyhedrovirus B TaxID=1580580 RepID=A0A0A7KV98_9ABAC|nr:asb052 [Agrotis segetum nucleopolyhedrovirus B]AIZ48610.1 asb052 [Agrotis segetum nucleopolyhedrovirus B]
MIQEKQAQTTSTTTTACVDLNVGEMFCCYTVRSVLIDEVSYCVSCAAALTDDLHRADVRFQHSTLNELASRRAPLYDGSYRCHECDALLVHIGDATQCTDCVDAVRALYCVAVNDGLINVVFTI